MVCNILYYNLLILTEQYNVIQTEIYFTTVNDILLASKLRDSRKVIKNSGARVGKWINASTTRPTNTELIALYQTSKARYRLFATRE
jgi:hypothetical protein